MWTAGNSCFITDHFPKAFRLALEPTHLAHWAPSAVSSMAKRPKREADYSSAYPAAVRNGRMYCVWLHFPHVLSGRAK